ncbi:hypothetical protein BEH_12020 [Priestia filamentosa]|uniref:Uncharacterized protein n=1 Tax=Priestia filamentosa TaxID=1402861 RepID=A0A0H4KGQ5_9BACI|nr:hypothetical protein BEH_12020 [Priestia filamentosa]OXS69314.1 hypothetical protein B1B01_10085 [Priestia filamentosa]RJS63970.1 hypothetical protein CJ485_04185 [Priestia filamentosa]
MQFSKQDKVMLNGEKGREKQIGTKTLTGEKRSRNHLYIGGSIYTGVLGLKLKSLLNMVPRCPFPLQKCNRQGF